MGGKKRVGNHGSLIYSFVPLLGSCTEDGHVQSRWTHFGGYFNHCLKFSTYLVSPPPILDFFFFPGFFLWVFFSMSGCHFHDEIIQLWWTLVGLLTLSLEFADDGVQESVLGSHMAPSHRHGSDPAMEPPLAPTGWKLNYPNLLNAALLHNNHLQQFVCLGPHPFLPSVLCSLSPSCSLQCDCRGPPII